MTLKKTFVAVCHGHPPKSVASYVELLGLFWGICMLGFLHLSSIDLSVLWRRPDLCTTFTFSTSV
jgi:hypothetical protein